MPDIWTTRPDHLRTFLEQLGARCGVEARILTPRDPEWTCHVDGKGWIGDIYIHELSGLWWSSFALGLYCAFLLLGLYAGVKLGKYLAFSP